MSRINNINKKKALTLRKEKILEELKYYERLIEEAKLNQMKQVECDESSDSDTDLPTLKIEPSITNLKIEHSALQTCFDATQELTDLQVLQSEVNVLVEDPIYNGEPPVTEEGIWKEVTVECRVDLVPFSMSFYVHQPRKRFGCLSYRSLKTTVLKKPHEAELNMSILQELSRPSEAFEVLKAYSSAHRSRRTTLAQLATSYSSNLRMAPLSDGGYQLKCGSLLEISWTLQNKTSPVAPFHHRMKFDLEYMDEAHVQTVKAVHKALSDPTISTDERTSLLSKIISICLEVQGINPPESTSGSEAAPSKQDLAVKRKRDEGAMAPPKAPPKKSRPKGKENKEENRLNRKPAKDNMGHRSSEMGSGRIEANIDGRSGATTSVASDHMIVKERAHNAKKLGEKDKKFKSAENGDSNKGVEVVKEASESNRKISTKNSAKDGVRDQIVTNHKGDGHHKKVIDARDRKKLASAVEYKTKNNEGKTAKDICQTTKKNSNSEAIAKPKDNDIEHVKKVSDIKDKKKHNNQIEKRDGEAQCVQKPKSKEKKGSNEIFSSKDKDTEAPKDTKTNKDVKVHEKFKHRHEENVHNAKKSTINHEIKNNQRENAKKNIELTIEKTTNSLPKDKQSKKKHADKVKPVNNTHKEIYKKTTSVETKKHSVEGKNLESTKTLKKHTNSATSELKTKLLKNQFSDRRSRDVDNLILKKNTRIPQKAPGSLQKIMKKNPLRISSRKSISKLKGVSPKIRKPLTHIPRLVNKPTVKK